MVVESVAITDAYPLSNVERKEVERKRISRLVNNKDGAEKNPDGKAHPFATYYICHKVIVKNNQSVRCDHMMVSPEEAIRHARSHVAEALSGKI